MLGKDKPHFLVCNVHVFYLLETLAKIKVPSE